MSRLGEMTRASTRQAANLSGLVACLFFWVGCASGPTDATGGDDASDSSRTAAGWVSAPPEACAVGSSGPTLNPGTAIRYARLAAIEALASGSLDVDVQTVTRSGSEGSFEVSAQALSGTLENARIVALWADTATAGVRSRLQQVYALACWPEASLSDLGRPAFPDWLIDPPSDSGKICATGISGPTRKADNQPASALRDARMALAVALESRIEKRIFDDGHGVAKIAREVEPSAFALARAATAGALDEDWLDERGTGPIGLPGVLYGLVCIED